MRFLAKKWSVKTLLLLQCFIAIGIAATLWPYQVDYKTPRLLLDAGATPRHAATYFVSGQRNIGVMGDSIVDPESESPYLSAEEVSAVFVEDKNWNKQEVFRLLGWLPNLELLAIKNVSLEDSDLEHLTSLPITMLVISGNDVTDQGLIPLASIKTLEKLWIDRTNTTQQGREKFRQTRPDVDVYDWP